MSDMAAARFEPEPKAKNRGVGRFWLGLVVGVMAAAVLVAGLVAAGMMKLGDTSDKSSGTAATGSPKSGPESRIEGPGFDTPEAAAMAYLEGLKAGDLDQMISAFAIESYVEHYDWAADVARSGQYQPNMVVFNCPFPATDQLGRQACIAARQSAVINQVIMPLAAHATPHFWSDGMANRLPGLDPAAEAQALQDQINGDLEAYLFGAMTNVEAVPPESISEVYLTQANQDNIAKQVKMFGLSSDQVQDPTVTFQLNGDTWLFAPMAGQYDGRWYLISPAGNVANLLGIEAANGGLSLLSR